MELDFIRSRALNNIPSRKLQETISVINAENIDLQTKSTKLSVINRYAESNIPLEYWSLKMERDFKGDPRPYCFFNGCGLELFNARPHS